MTKTLTEAQTELQTAVEAVEQAKGELRAEVEDYEATQDMDAKIVADLQDVVNGLKQEQETVADVADVAVAKELQKKINEAVEELELTQQVNAQMEDKAKAKIGEQAGALIKAVKQARAVFSKTDKIMIQHTSLATIVEDNQYMKEQAQPINSAGGYAKAILLDFGLITRSDVRFNGVHLNAMDSMTELKYLFDPQTLSDHGVVKL